MKRKTNVQKAYEEELQRKMDTIDTPQELIEFIKTECTPKIKAMNDAFGKVIEILERGQG
jgi:hypothetical protein